jgi:hypothetical protein
VRVVSDGKKLEVFQILPSGMTPLNKPDGICAAQQNGDVRHKKCSFM